MVEITNEISLKKWLQGRERADAVAIAARVALRVLPLTVSLVRQEPEKWSAVFVLPFFRANSISWVAAVGPTVAPHDIANAAYAAASVAEAAAFAARTSDAARAADAAYAAADAARAAFATNAAADAARAAEAAAFAALAATYAAAMFWKAVTADVNALDQNTITAADLVQTRLWPEGVEQPSKLLKDWDGLRRLLLEREGEDWRVWTDWYDARLAGGGVINRDLETARVLIPDGLWKQGPKVVNAEIRRLIDEHEEDDEQPDRDFLATIVSPQPVIVDGIYDSVPNVQQDEPDEDRELRELPIVQRSVIRTLLELLKEHPQVRQSVSTALHEYSEELRLRETRPIVGLLKSQYRIVSDEYKFLSETGFVEKDGFRGAYLEYQRHHRQIIKHFPLDSAREAAYAKVPVNFDELDRGEVIRLSVAFTAEVKALGESQQATPTFVTQSLLIADDLRAALETQAPPPGTLVEAADPDAPFEIHWTGRSLIRATSYLDALTTEAERWTEENVKATRQTVGDGGIVTFSAQLANALAKAFGG